ncbi:MAG: DUF2059 domain-containing protein [Candidatus Omnitrophota bacterium]
MKRLVYIILFLIVFSASSQADTIILKDGRTIEGEIFEETAYSVKVKVKSTPKVFYRDEIERVERPEKEVEEAKETEPELTLKDVSERKKELILKLLEANGAVRGIKANLRALLGQMPEDQTKEFERLVNADEFILRLVPVYAKYYTEEELGDLIEFYSSPSGKKNFEVMPYIIQESITAAIKYFEDLPKP